MQPAEVIYLSKFLSVCSISYYFLLRWRWCYPNDMGTVLYRNQIWRQQIATMMISNMKWQSDLLIFSFIQLQNPIWIYPNKKSYLIISHKKWKIKGGQWPLTDSCCWLAYLSFLRRKGRRLIDINVRCCHLAFVIILQNWACNYSHSLDCPEPLSKWWNSPSLSRYVSPSPLPPLWPS